MMKVFDDLSISKRMTGKVEDMASRDRLLIIGLTVLTIIVILFSVYSLKKILA